MKGKRFLAIIVTLSLLVLMAGAALADVPTDVYGEALQNHGIVDVAPQHWATAAIIHLYDAGILQGDGNGNFRPEAATRFSEGVAVIARVLGIATKGDSLDATIAKAQSAGLVTPGQGANAGRDMTRLEMAQLIAKALKIQPKAGATLAGLPFTDSASIPADQAGILAALYELGIFKGFPDGTFQASGTLTRSQIAVLVERILGKV